MTQSEIAQVINVLDSIPTTECYEDPPRDPDICDCHGCNFSRARLSLL